MVEKINGGNTPDYNKITLKNTKTGKNETFLIPLGKKVTIGKNEYDMSKLKNGELVLTGDGKKDSDFQLTGLTLEKMDTNKDGKIDEKDTDPKLAEKLNQGVAKDSKYYVFDAGDDGANAYVEKGEGGAVFSTENGAPFEFGIEKND